MTEQQTDEGVVAPTREVWVEHMIHVCVALDFYLKDGANDGARWRRLVAASETEREACRAYLGRWASSD